MITILSKTFTSIREAFQYFTDEIYPNLDSKSIQDLKSPVYYFRSGRVISDDRMEKILKQYGNAKVEKNVIVSFE